MLIHVSLNLLVFHVTVSFIGQAHTLDTDVGRK